MKKNEVPINTPEWLRSFKGCEQLTDEQANQIIDSLKTLACILLKSTGDSGTLIDNQLVIQSKTLIDANKINRAA